MKSLLIDVHNLLWRFFSVTPDLPQLTVSHIAMLAEQFGVDYCFCALDHGTPAYRKILCDYKAQRRGKIDDDKRQAFYEFAAKAIDMLRQVYVVIGVHGFEADDILAYLSKNLMGDKIIVSADTDYFQLLSDTVLIYNGHDLYTSEVFFERFGFTPDKFIIYRAMVGDRSDNIKGVRGVGEATAKKLLQKINTIEELFAYSEASTDRLIHKVVEQKEAFYRAFAVIELPAPGITEILGEKLPYLYTEVKESSLPFVQEWIKKEIESNLQNVKNSQVI